MAPTCDATERRKHGGQSGDGMARMIDRSWSRGWSQSWTRRALTAGTLACIGLLLGSGSASATASFTETRFGFVASDLTGLPEIQMGGTDPFLDAGDPVIPETLDVELIGSTNLCILAQGSSTCRATTGGLTTPYSAIMSVEVNILDPDLAGGPLTLLLTQLGPDDDPANVRIVLDPSLPAGFDSSTVPAFVFDPTNGVGGFDPVLAVRDETFADAGVVFHYLGFTVRDGDRLTFMMDVLSAPGGAPAPELLANATTVVVPEPGAVVLLGLGLAGLGWAGQRRQSRPA